MKTKSQIFLLTIFLLISFPNVSQAIPIGPLKKIFTEGNSKGIDKDGTVITADNFDYDKIKNILKVNGNIEFIDSQKEIKIYSDSATYLKQEEKIFESFKCVNYS